MYRHLYRQPTLLSRMLIKEYANYKCEEFAFRQAALSQLRQNSLDYEALHQLEIVEHWEISKASILPQLFTMFNSLHRATRSQPVIKYLKIEAVNRMTALLDPNMFPVQDLKLQLHGDEAVSVWRENSKLSQVKGNIGFWLDVKQSSIDHIDAGNGVFLRTQQGGHVPPGTLLGLVPGVVYENYKEFDAIHPNSPPDMHFHRFDGTVVGFEDKIYYPHIPGYAMQDYQHKVDNLVELAKHSRHVYRNIENAGFEQVHGKDINPYAVGHLINHTPRDQSTNVCLVDLFIPVTFFPYEMMKFFPCMAYTNEKEYMSVSQHWLHKQYPKDKFIRGLGIMSVDNIKNGQELYLDYIESCLYDMQIDVPDWLIKPPPLHPQITKSNYQTQTKFLTGLLEDIAFKQTQDGQNYDKFMAKILREKQYL